MAEYCTKKINALYAGNKILNITHVPKLFLLRPGDMPVEIDDKEYATILEKLTSYYFPGLSKWQGAMNENAVIALVNRRCGYCTELKPILKNVSDHFKGTNLRFVNIHIPFGLMEFYTEKINALYAGNDIININGVPKLFLLKPGHVPIEMNNDRKYNTILNKLTSYYNPMNIYPDVNKWQDAMDEHAIVAILSDQDKLLNKALKSIEQKLSETRINVKILNTPSTISTYCSDALNALYTHNPIQSANIPKVYLFMPNYLPIEIHDRTPENIRKTLLLYYNKI